MTDQAPPMIVFYDGLCGFCDRTVQYILDRDGNDRFRFAPLQSDLAEDVLSKHGKDPKDLNTLYLLVDQGLPTEEVFQKSTAVIRIGKELGGSAAKRAKLIGWIPTWLRDLGYNLVAKVRYRLYGKMDSCRIPSPKDRAKFIGV